MKMEQWKIIVSILLIFSLFLIMSSVSAADITINSTTNFKQNIDSAPSGSNIILNSDKEYSLNSDNVDITLDKKITIKSSKSSKNTIINLNKNGCAFIIMDEGYLTLINITIINGKSDYGGAIINHGTLILTACTFKNSNANNAGAIFNRGSATFTGCTFLNNKATGVDYGGDGGAIANSGNIKLTRCTFKNNEAVSNGGVISNSDGRVTLIDCTFTNNKAVTYGGSISGDGTFTLTRCTFISNKAISGGAINTNAKLTAINCTFTKNTAKYGGAITGTGTITGCNFTNNMASIFGGAISVENIILKVCIFSNNQAKRNGGAIYAWADSTHPAKLKIIKTTFKNNIVTNKMIYNVFYTLKGTKVTKSGVKISPKEGTKFKKADLKITKITKKGNYRYVVVKNMGNKASNKNTLGVYIGDVLIKKAIVKSIGPGKTLKVTIIIPKTYRTSTYSSQYKVFKVDITNSVKEINKDNNYFKAK